MADETKHLNFFDQIIHTLMDVSESVDLPACKMRGGCHQVLIFRPKGKLVGKGCRVNVRPNAGMLGNILHSLPVVIDNMMKIFEALHVIFFGHNSFHFGLLLKSIEHRGKH
jgi:hypothetical protein